MNEDLKVLVRLQQADSAMDVVSRTLSEYPAQIETLTDELKKAEEVLRLEKEQKAELEKEQRRYERELQAVNDELDKYNKRLFEVKTNREYQALLQEIGVQKSRIEEFEGKILERMTALDDLAAVLKKYEVVYTEKKSETSRRIQVLETERATLEKDLRLMQEERKMIMVDVDSRMLRTYERVRGKNRGLAVVAVQKEACGGCFERLPPHCIQKIRRDEEIIFCENCGSILAWDEEGQLENQHNVKNRRERSEQNR